MTEASLAQNEEVNGSPPRGRPFCRAHPDRHHHGMNFDTMPELHRPLGYPMAVFLMIAMGVVLYQVFKRRRWL